LLQFNNKPKWEVLTGRRDGTVSNNFEVFQNIPAPFHNLTELRQNFAKKKLTLHDLVVLSGTFNSIFFLIFEFCYQYESLVDE
jgi:hypothetical protein